jgi:hypothetical protein
MNWVDIGKETVLFAFGYGVRELFGHFLHKRENQRIAEYLRRIAENTEKPKG